MTTYTSEYPNMEVDPAIKAFFEEFYKISDSPDAHEKYADQFTKDGILIIASKKAEGRAGIVNMRHGMWEKVSSRVHNPIKVFPFGPKSDEVMLHGVVVFGLKAGGEASKEWGARAHLVKEDGTMKMDFYQVYLDTA